ncbi:hypothetical protein PGB34_18820 [Xenophilus arseniciresistens]|uniref:Uncharacterized protein n=1 Tax=Xenophilus arseniciresistens TaxID=1283306 RepID=A0AAE3T0P4_9BURK|nr:hypothetical protein [Xenophilus arseniciresistens]MDA7418427.1 hypothetical protein [Xenophilus arseniciresistens]
MGLHTRTIALSIALGTAGLCAPAHAQAPDPCALYLCMASVSGQGSPSASCTSAIQFWHTPSPAGLAVWTYYPVVKFWEDISYQVRQQYMNNCQGSTNTPGNQAISNAIMSQWGRVP